MSKQDNKPANKPLRLEIGENDEKYRIHSESGRLSILRSMMQNNSLATCYFDHSDRFILTTVIDVDAEQGEIVLDYGADEASNQQALKANILNIAGLLYQVKIQFICQGVEKIQFEERDAFLTQIPETLLRIQRREYYRVDTPAVIPATCVMPLTGGDKSATVVVILQNISYGGMAVIDPQSRLNFERGTVYRHCLVALPEIGTARVNLRVQHVSEIYQKNGLKFSRAGCEFIDTPDSMLSMIQRYISRLEQKRKQ